MKRYGDILLIDNGNEYIMVACDSSGGIGSKTDDLIKIDPALAGYFAAFVPIVETLAAKGSVICLADTLCVEMEPTGVKVIEGIGRAMMEIGVDPSLLTGSTEDNIPTQTTGIGVTVIGKIGKNAIDGKQVRRGDRLMLIGIPKVGQEFLDEELNGRGNETLTLMVMKKLSADEKISDMLPVGSKGISHEANVFADRYSLEVRLEEVLHRGKPLDYDKSAGPSTCILAAVRQEFIEAVESEYPMLPVNVVGSFE